MSNVEPELGNCLEREEVAFNFHLLSFIEFIRGIFPKPEKKKAQERFSSIQEIQKNL